MKYWILVTHPKNFELMKEDYETLKRGLRECLID